MQLGVSVIICCSNSIKRLPKTLEHLSKQYIPTEISWEIIVVDNASKDGTAGIAEDIWSNLNMPDVILRIFEQPIAGKTHALKTGIDKSSYEYILICDDDNWLFPDYIAKAYEIMQQNSSIGALGGKGIAVSDAELPIWFEKYQHGYAVGSQSPSCGDISPLIYLWGAGMVLRKSIYSHVYSKYPSLLTGPKGKLITRGEDVELCLRILFSGYKLFYDDNLIFKHYMPENRLTEKYRDTLYKGYDNEKQILGIYFKQHKISKLFTFQKVTLFLLSMIRALISKIYIKCKWSYHYECETLYLLSGVNLQIISEESKLIHNIYCQLSNNL